MAPSLFWSRMPSLLLSLTLSSHDHQPGAEAAGLGAKMAQVFPTTHRLVEVREEVFGKAHDPELVLNLYVSYFDQKKASTAKTQPEKLSCLLQMGKLRQRVAKILGSHHRR